jgi:hypothetical protein
MVAKGQMSRRMPATQQIGDQRKRQMSESTEPELAMAPTGEATKWRKSQPRLAMKGNKQGKKAEPRASRVKEMSRRTRPAVMARQVGESNEEEAARNLPRQTGQMPDQADLVHEIAHRLNSQ